MLLAEPLPCLVLAGIALPCMHCELSRPSLALALRQCDIVEVSIIDTLVLPSFPCNKFRAPPTPGTPTHRTSTTSTIGTHI